MHSKNFRGTDDEKYKKKNILIIGSKWSGMDMLFQFLGAKDESKMADFNTITVAQGNFGFLDKSTNFKKYYDEEKVIIKSANKMVFSEDKVQFEDGSETQIDVVIFCTGYQYKFPFLKDESIIKIEHNGQYFGPTYKRIFSAKDPTLIFIGNIDGPTLEFYIERHAILAKYFIEGKLKLPTSEEMVADAEQFMAEVPDAPSYYKSPPDVHFKLFGVLHQLLLDSGIDAPPLNEEFYKKQQELTSLALQSLCSGDYLDFKSLDCKGYEVSDSSEFF
uniref:Flavin-containing monooxygenase n=1 Tax=Euplotes harpa TaxID=151035 RepID=A0A7S3NEM9_9SPIT|mmetsp:Transcript_37836/g.43472  ORF Transcript_37836/g.43472 Transcript_37836/m.43472 type:complete len:275 (+) Transcript_37836:563-1387(+)